MEKSAAQAGTQNKNLGHTRNQNPRSSVSTDTTKPAKVNNFHVGLEPWALKSSFRNFQKVDLSSLSDKATIEPFRRRAKQQDKFGEDSESNEARIAKCITKGGTSVHSIYVTSADGVMPISFDSREFLSRACERASVTTNTDPQLVLRLESACVTDGAQGILEYGFWVVYLKSFQRKSEALLEQFRGKFLRSWVDFFATVPIPKEPVADRFCPILVEALLFIFTEAFPKSKSLVNDRSFAVYVYRCVYRELLGVPLASVTVDRLRSNHVRTPPRNPESPRGMRQAPPSPQFSPLYHRDAYINGDEGAISIMNQWWDPDEDPLWEEDARKQAIRQRAGMAPANFGATTYAATADQFFTTLVSPAVHSMSNRRALRFANDPGRRVRVGEYHAARMVDLRPKRTRPVIQDGGKQSKEEQQQISNGLPPVANSSPLSRSGTSPAAFTAVGQSNMAADDVVWSDVQSRTHRLVLAEQYAKKRATKELERFLPPKYGSLDQEIREVLKKRKHQQEEQAQENARNARLSEGRRDVVQAGGARTSSRAAVTETDGDNHLPNLSPNSTMEL